MTGRDRSIDYVSGKLKKMWQPEGGQRWSIVLDDGRAFQTPTEHHINLRLKKSSRKAGQWVTLHVSGTRVVNVEWGNR